MYKLISIGPTVVIAPTTYTLDGDIIPGEVITLAKDEKVRLEYRGGGVKVVREFE